MYQLHVKTKEKELFLTREQAPALENLLDALKFQRIDIQRNEADSEKLQKDWMNALVDFALRFWCQQWTAITKLWQQWWLP